MKGCTFISYFDVKVSATKEDEEVLNLSLFLSPSFSPSLLSSIAASIPPSLSDPRKPPTHSYLPGSLEVSEYKNRSYRLVHGNMSWYAALSACVEQEAELVSITDPFHQAYLTVLVNKLGFPHWIGLYSQDVCWLTPFQCSRTLLIIL